MILRRFMQVFFHLLYHPLAFTYDLVAAVVSFGQWQNWIQSILPFIEGRRILELGHGPGHLQRILLNLGLIPYAIDESAEMGRLARKRLGPSHKLSRAMAQSLPFQSDSFDTVISTFPTEYIFDGHTLSEAKRVLRPTGRLIVLPAAWPKNEFLKWLYRITGETPFDLNGVLITRLVQPFKDAGFDTETQIIEVKSSNLLIVMAKKR